MKQLTYTIAIFSSILLFFIGVEAIIQLIYTANCYQFQNYTIMGWIAQILYWFIAVSVSTFSALDTIKE